MCWLHRWMGVAAVGAPIGHRIKWVLVVAHIVVGFGCRWQNESHAVGRHLNRTLLFRSVHLLRISVVNFEFLSYACRILKPIHGYIIVFGRISPGRVCLFSRNYTLWVITSLPAGWNASRPMFHRWQRYTNVLIPLDLVLACSAYMLQCLLYFLTIAMHMHVGRVRHALIPPIYTERLIKVNSADKWLTISTRTSNALLHSFHSHIEHMLRTESPCAFEIRLFALKWMKNIGLLRCCCHFSAELKASQNEWTTFHNRSDACASEIETHIGTQIDVSILHTVMCRCGPRRWNFPSSIFKK